MRKGLRRIVKRWNDDDADYRYYLQVMSSGIPAVGDYPAESGNWLSSADSYDIEWAQRNAEHYGIEIVDWDKS